MVYHIQEGDIPVKNFCQKIVAPFIVTLTVLNFVVLAISASHPILVTLFMFLNIGCALVIILIGAFVLSSLCFAKWGESQYSFGGKRCWPIYTCSSVRRKCRIRLSFP